MSGKSSRLKIKVIPNASRNMMVGWLNGVMKIKVAVPPLDGRANEALCAFVAESLELPKRAVSIEHGEKSRQKVLLLEGISEAELYPRLELLIK